MRKLFLMIAAMFFVGVSAFAQQEETKISKLKSGKYFNNKNSKLISGIWRTIDNKFEITVKVDKKHIKTGQADGLDFYTDVLLVTFSKVIFQEGDLSKKFDKISIEFVGIEGDIFVGSYRDPITQNDVSVTFTPKNGYAEFLSKIYTITSIGNVKDGISFPYRLSFKKYSLK